MNRDGKVRKQCSRALTWNILPNLVHENVASWSEQVVNKPRMEGRRPESCRDGESNGSRTCGSSNVKKLRGRRSAREQQGRRKQVQLVDQVGVGLVILVFTVEIIMHDVKTIPN
ncbi:hypothetical protein PoB_006112900 [Plakobranchus ocellatus]|uniref:Uncharacterized protein n=1 Tax=Plakobranchus ocellatus TaxID=259542 RepID=A0AAV4CRV8_9GAST|nr:hypothetical protein PoB_006112900 [Plakobranchus ocellatus]